MSEKVRLDKWLWAVRIYKSRTLSTDECRKGRVKVNGQDAKPARMIEVGDIVEVKKGLLEKKYEVIHLLEKRVGAEQAAAGVRDLSPEAHQLVREKLDATPIARRERGAGRPTKKERRTLDEIRHWEG